MERRVEKRGHRLCPASRESPCVVISSPGKMRCQRARPWRVGGEQKANGQCTSQRRRAEQRLAGDPAACAAVRRCRCAREKSFPADPFESHYDRLSGGLSSSSSSPPPFSALRCSCPLSNSLRARERPSLACSPSLTIFSPLSACPISVVYPLLLSTRNIMIIFRLPPPPLISRLFCLDWHAPLLACCLFCLREVERREKKKKARDRTARRGGSNVNGLLIGFAH